MPTPEGVDLAVVRPRQGQDDPVVSVSVGFTYGYSRCPLRGTRYACVRRCLTHVGSPKVVAQSFAYQKLCGFSSIVRVAESFSERKT
jgi:hypothetical protein